MLNAICCCLFWISDRSPSLSNRTAGRLISVCPDRRMTCTVSLNALCSGRETRMAIHAPCGARPDVDTGTVFPEHFIISTQGEIGVTIGHRYKFPRIQSTALFSLQSLPWLKDDSAIVVQHQRILGLPCAYSFLYAESSNSSTFSTVAPSRSISCRPR